MAFGAPLGAYKIGDELVLTPNSVASTPLSHRVEMAPVSHRMYIAPLSYRLAFAMLSRQRFLIL